MTTTLPLKRGFATIGNSKYRTPFAPPTSLDGAEPANPKQALPLPVTELLVPKVVPTTEASHRKSNAQIPYTRVVTDTRHLPDDGDVVFIRSPDGRKAAGKMRVSANDKTDMLAGLSSINEAIAAAAPRDQIRLVESWTVDGILLNTEREMDTESAHAEDEPLASSTAVLISLQGPTVLRNIFSDRPLVGDWCYVGMVTEIGQAPQLVPFSSQHLDMNFKPEPPVAPQLGFATTVTRKRERVTFTAAQARGLCYAFCLGRVVDSSPSDGNVTVNVNVQRMSWQQIGIRHDEENCEVFEVPRELELKMHGPHLSKRGATVLRYHYPRRRRIGGLCAFGRGLCGKVLRAPPRIALEEEPQFCRHGPEDAPVFLDAATEAGARQRNRYVPIVQADCAIATTWFGFNVVGDATEYERLVAADVSPEFALRYRLAEPAFVAYLQNPNILNMDDIISHIHVGGFYPNSYDLVLLQQLEAAVTEKLNTGDDGAKALGSALALLSEHADRTLSALADVFYARYTERGPLEQWQLPPDGLEDYSLGFQAAYTSLLRAAGMVDAETQVVLADILGPAAMQNVLPANWRPTLSPLAPPGTPFQLVAAALKEDLLHNADEQLWNTPTVAGMFLRMALAYELWTLGDDY